MKASKDLGEDLAHGVRTFHGVLRQEYYFPGCKNTGRENHSKHRNSLCKGDKEACSMCMGGKTRNAAGLEICARMEPRPAESVRKS